MELPLARKMARFCSLSTVKTFWRRSSSPILKEEVEISPREADKPIVDDSINSEFLLEIVGMDSVVEVISPDEGDEAEFACSMHRRWILEQILAVEIDALQIRRFITFGIGSTVHCRNMARLARKAKRTRISAPAAKFTAVIEVLER